MLGDLEVIIIGRGEGGGDRLSAPLTINFVRTCTMVVLQLSPGETEEIFNEPFGTVGTAYDVRNGCVSGRPGSLPRDRTTHMSMKETVEEIDV